MSTYTRWSTDTGEIIDNITISDALLYLYNTHCTEGTWNQGEYYFVDGEPTLRPEQNTIIDKTELDIASLEFATFAYLPTPCKIYITGPVTETLNLTEPTFFFSAVIPGTYSFVIEGFPYLPKEWTIDAL